MRSAYCRLPIGRSSRFEGPGLGQPGRQRSSIAGVPRRGIGNLLQNEWKRFRAAPYVLCVDGARLS